MTTARRFIALAIAVTCIGLWLAGPAAGDWNEGDGHKMHHPQLPDPFGWDVNVTADQMLDDWQCSQSGFVRDVHLWVSWMNDQASPLLWVNLEIWSDKPRDAPDNELGFSYPDKWLWGTSLDPMQFTIAGPFSGNQGWYDPQPPDGQTILPNNHVQYWQINIPDIPDPFYQVKDTIYWLGVHIGPSDPNTAIGWKTTLNPWNDDAVYWYTDGDEQTLDWHELYYPPTFQESLNFAFVITPEPATLALLGLGFMLMTRRRG